MANQTTNQEQIKSKDEKFNTILEVYWDWKISSWMNFARANKEDIEEIKNMDNEKLKWYIIDMYFMISVIQCSSLRDQQLLDLYYAEAESRWDKFCDEVIEILDQIKENKKKWLYDEYSN